MDDLVERLRAAVPAALAGEPVAFALLHGSHAAGTAGPRSDVDVAVHLIEDAHEVDQLELRLRVAGALERTLGTGPVDVVVLDDAPLALAGRVAQHGVVVHDADPVARVRWTSLTLRRYHDFRIHEQRNARERLAAIADGGD